MATPIDRLPLGYPLRKKGTRLTFPARVMLYVVSDLLIINLLVFCFIAKVPLAVVLLTYAVEVLAIGAGVAVWARWHRLKW